MYPRAEDQAAAGEGFSIFAILNGVQSQTQRPTQLPSSNVNDGRQDASSHQHNSTPSYQQGLMRPWRPRGLNTPNLNSSSPSSDSSVIRHETNCPLCGYVHRMTYRGTSVNSEPCSQQGNNNSRKNDQKSKESKEEPIACGKGSKGGAKDDKTATNDKSKTTSGDKPGKDGDGDKSTGKGNGDKPGKDGDGDKSTGKGNGDGSGKGGDGDKSTGKGNGDGSGKGGGGDPDDDDGPNGDMNGDDRRVCPDVVSDGLFFGLLFVCVVVIFIVYRCSGSTSFLACVSGRSSGCAVNENVMNFLNKAGIKRGGGTAEGGATGGSNQKLDIPAHLEEGLRQFKTAIKNKDCFKSYGGDSKCEGLVNYAGVMAGGSVSSIGNTEEMPNPMLCRCLDAKLYKQLCIPDEGECRVCACDKIDADTLITEDDKLVPGRCWAFRGVGQLQIRLFFPLIILGVTIHHPAKSRLPPGFFKSAPKDFELWGISDKLDKDPYRLGTFQYKEHGGITQIFEVQNPTPTFYSQVKFNFTTNHGNPNYTAVYKLEVHGLVDF